MSQHALSVPLTDPSFAQRRHFHNSRAKLEAAVQRNRQTTVRRRPWRRSHPFVVPTPYVPRHLAPEPLDECDWAIDDLIAGTGHCRTCGGDETSQTDCVMEMMT